MTLSTLIHSTVKAVVGLAVLTSCAASVGTSQPASSTSDEFTPRDFQVADLGDHPLECGARGGCSESVGQMVNLTASGYESCTFTLITPTIILTAAHCVNWKNVNEDFSMKEGCFVRFAAKPGENKNSPDLQPIACNAIIDSTHVGADVTTDAKADYAYIELAKPSSRKALPIVSSPFAKLSPRVDITVIDPGLKVDVMRALSCMQDPTHQLRSRTRWTPSTIVLPDCPIHFGNSGAPIFSSTTREIFGVISFIDENLENRTAAVGSRVPMILK